MAEVTLKAEKRSSTGKGAARKTRAAGRVPAVVYGPGMEPVPIEVDRRELVNAFHTDAGTNVLVDLDIDGGVTLALARELQRDPVRGTLLHADFVKVERTQRVEVEVPIHLAGEAPGVKEGGVLEQPLFQVEVGCLPTDVPDSIEADVSRLGTGDTLKVSDLPEARGYEILTDPDTVIASVVAPVTEAELEAMEAAVAEGGPEEVPAAQTEARAGMVEGAEEGATESES